MGQNTAQRIKDRLFPNENLFDPKKGIYSALPFILRKLQFLFEPRLWQVYTYILMKTGPAGVAWFELREMAFDLGFKSTPKLKPYVKNLCDAGWIRCGESSGKDYYFVRDPLIVLREIWSNRTKLRNNQLWESRTEPINDLLEMLKLPTLEDHDDLIVLTE